MSTVRDYVNNTDEPIEVNLEIKLTRKRKIAS